MAVGCRWRSSWIMSDTSCLVRTPLRSNSSTKASFSHMVEMASFLLVTSSYRSSGLKFWNLCPLAYVAASHLDWHILTARTPLLKGATPSSSFPM